MSGRLAQVTISLSDQELVDHPFSGLEQTSEQSAFKLFRRHSLPNGFLSQGKQQLRQLHKYIRLAQFVSSCHAHQVAAYLASDGSLHLHRIA
jgi:hypothetical protein